jgi:hypothetical protein
LKREDFMKKIFLVLFLGLIGFGLFAQVTDAQIREAANTLGVPFEVLKPIVNSYAPADNVPQITGTIVPGNNLNEKLAWLQKSVDSHNTYIIEVNANENIDHYTFFYQGAINVTIVLRGDGENRILRLRSNGTMFTVRANVTFILDNNITLMGHNGNNGRMVNVNAGLFKMNAGATISGNTGGGVYVGGGNFEMSGGVITGNTANVGGGVLVGGYFVMSGGLITGNTANEGGGVYVNDRTSFNMTGGTITGNLALRGGAVFIDAVLSGGAFNMRGGTITGNTARENGGGVFFKTNWNVNGSLNKTGGTITGYSSDQSNGNVVRDGAGDVLARRGHAVFQAERRKETTAGPDVNLRSDNAGGWDN